MTEQGAMSLAPQKKLQLPPHVIEVKEELKKKKGASLNTMKKLTEPDDLSVAGDLEKMWAALEGAEKKKYRVSRLKSNAWVHYFVMYAAFYSSFPDYYYQNKTERKKLLEDISRRSEHLTKMLQRHRFDHHLTYSAKKKAYDFSEKMSSDDLREFHESGVEAPTVSILLERLLRHIEEDLKNVPTYRNDKSAKARQFVYDMALYLKNTYGTQLNAVIAAATLAIHGVNYSESQISKILQRTDMGKGEDEFRPFAHPETWV